MGLEGAILNEIYRGKETNTVWFHSYVKYKEINDWGKKMIDDKTGGEREIKDQIGERTQ